MDFPHGQLALTGSDPPAAAEWAGGSQQEEEERAMIYSWYCSDYIDNGWPRAGVCCPCVRRWNGEQGDCLDVGEKMFSLEPPLGQYGWLNGGATFVYQLTQPLHV